MPVPGPDGERFKARACALPMPKGTWQGWIEFNPLNGEPTFRSPRETVQPSKHAIVVWADTLTPPALIQALDRALERIKPLSSSRPSLV